MRKTPRRKVTFRIPPDLAAALHHLPNQTAFVESALRDALGRTCPVCHGPGEAPEAHLSISNLKRVPSGRLDRESAAQLKALVRLGRQLLATQLDLETSSEEPGLGFRLARDNQVLLAGRIPGGQRQLKLTH